MDNIDAFLSYDGPACPPNHEAQLTMADNQLVSNDGDVSTGSGSVHHAPAGV